jgi:hypothetical protein
MLRSQHCRIYMHTSILGRSRYTLLYCCFTAALLHTCIVGRSRSTLLYCLLYCCFTASFTAAALLPALSAARRHLDAGVTNRAPQGNLEIYARAFLWHPQVSVFELLVLVQQVNWALIGHRKVISRSMCTRIPLSRRPAAPRYISIATYVY